MKYIHHNITPQVQTLKIIQILHNFNGIMGKKYQKIE